MRFAVGFVTFVVAHAIESSQWHGWFRGLHEPWFLNSGRAILFTLGCLALASAAVAVCERSAPPARGISTGAGAFAAMASIMFLSGSGPGTLFPIVLVFGGALLLTSSTSGAWVGRKMRGASKRQR